MKLRAGNLRGSRLDIAVVLSNKELSANQIAQALGKQTGSIFGVLKRMHAEGLIETDTEPPTRGAKYSLADETRGLLDEALAERSDPGLLAEDRQILVVEGTNDALALQEVLATVSVSRHIAWGASLGWGQLLVLDEETDDFHAQRLAIALQRAGYSCRGAALGAIKDGADLREQALTLVDGEDL